MIRNRPGVCSGWCFLVAIVVVVAFAIWLAVTGSLQAAAWTTYNVTHHCVDVVATRNNCFALGQTYSTLNNFALVNLGLARGDACASRPRARRTARRWEIEQGTNRSRGLSPSRDTVAPREAGRGCARLLRHRRCHGALAEWWTGVIHRGARILPSPVRYLRVRSTSPMCSSPSCSELPWARSSAGPDGPSRWEFPFMRSPVRCAGLRSAKSGLTLDRGESRGKSRSWWHFISHSANA